MSTYYYYYYKKQPETNRNNFLYNNNHRQRKVIVIQQWCSVKNTTDEYRSCVHATPVESCTYRRQEYLKYICHTVRIPIVCPCYTGRVVYV